jgi:hypothetical protein
MSRLTLVLSLLGLVITPAPVLAMRVISIAVEQDGKEVLIGAAGDDGFPGPHTVWRYLKTSPLHPAPGFNVQPELGRPLEAVLRGKLLVKVRYGADVEASELKLTRRQAGSDAWFIDPSWVENNGPPGDSAEEARRIAEGRSKFRSKRDAYRRGSLIAVGAAAVSWTAGLIALIFLLTGKRGQMFGWVCLAALVFGGLAVAWNFIGEPYFPDDEQSYKLRSYAVCAGVASGGLAVITWLIGHWCRGPAEQNAAPDRSRM